MTGSTMEASVAGKLQINTTWRNDNPATIWNVLAARLGRQPTNDEAAAS